MNRVEWRFVGVMLVPFVVPIVVWWLAIEPRLLSAVVGLVAFSVLAYQFFANYRESPTLARAAIVLVQANLLIGAVIQFQITQSPLVVPITYGTYPLLGQRVGCLLLALFWPKLLAYGTRSPWVKAQHRR